MVLLPAWASPNRARTPSSQRSLDHIHASAIPLAALTAWQTLFDAAQLEAGQTVLIHAAAGGVGSFAVQLAKWKGARVIGTASKRNLEFVRQLGADEAIDYQTTRFEDVVCGSMWYWTALEETPRSGPGRC
jgi:NADPH:quinone reductase-like Zn-dependent oxidoreductase